ncbi:MAG: hypothetical protein ACYS0G_07010 [Planctomycetota bacterium]|jgi:hypothetical protein
MKSHLIMFLYAIFLLACGLVAYFMAPEGAKASTALLVSGGTAAVMVACGVMARLIGRNRPVGIVGSHAGLILPLIFAVLFGVRAIAAFRADTDKLYLAVTLSIMTAGSLAAFAAILATRPKADRRAAT